MRSLAAIAALGTLAACGPARAPANGGGEWSYVVTPPAASAEQVVEVEATFGDTERLVIPADGAAALRRVRQKVDGGWRDVERSGGGWELSSCRAPCTVRYAVDLPALARACDDELDCAVEREGATIGPVSQWLLRPSARDAAITLRVRGGGPHAFGMRRRGDAYVFRAGELVEGSYTAFGAVRRQRLPRTDATVDVAFLGAPLAMSDEAFAGIVGEAVDVLARFYGRFPVDVTVFVCPSTGDSVRFGSVMALTGASVALIVGRDMRPETAHTEWVVMHELFHLGPPTFGGGSWLGEGLATYYEPLLRARAGWIGEADLWRHFVEEMPRGVRPEGSARAIEDRHDVDSRYWGGALFAMLADVRIRAATGGAKSLDDVLLAMRARGADVTHVWSVREFVRVGDAATGTSVLSDLHESFAVRGEPVDIDRALAKARAMIPARTANPVVSR